MRTRDLIDLVLLAAIWGASFLFMRVAAPEFGPVAMSAVRVAVASIVLMPLLVLGGDGASLVRHWRPLALVGVLNSALPFVLFGYASLVITAGLASVFNAATPLFAALIAWLWLREPLTRWRLLGLVVGMAGVLGLAWHRAGGALGAQPGADDLAAAGAVLACLLATLLYGFSVNFARQRLAGVPAIAQATGSQLAAALALAVPTAITWPARMPGGWSWLSVLALALLCSALAYILYFRLIANVGATRAASVTFLIPVFAVLWGGWLLNEPIDAPMVLACLVIVIGTSLVVGLWPRRA